VDIAKPADSAAKPAEAVSGQEASAGGEGVAAAAGGGGGAAAGGAAAGNQTVVVQQGQTLGAIAKQFGVGICDIAKASGIADPNLIDVGQTLTIPPPTATPDNTSCLPPPPPPATERCVLGGPDRLTIPADGITAEQAAKFLNITQDAFVAANQAAIPSNSSAKLAGGSVMAVPVCPNSQCTISQGTVKKGDIFDKIAAEAGSTTGQILGLNPGIDRFNLAVGQTFTLPSNCQNVTGNAGAGGNATAAAPAKAEKEKESAAKR
jgi:LysM repeat protein